MLTLQIKEKEIENLTPEEEFVRGTVGAKCQINFDEFWQSYNKYIVFKRVGYEPINFMVDTLENEIEIPYTILAESGEFKIGVFGTTETETLPTLYSKDIKILYGTDTHGTTPPTYIPSEIDQLRLSKQDKLVSGENIKTVNGESVLGSGNIKIQVEVDQTYTPASENAQSGIAVAEAIKRGATTIPEQEHAQLGEELVSATGWITDGWTGDLENGFTHINGNTNSLKFTMPEATGTKTLSNIIHFKCSNDYNEFNGEDWGSELFNLYGQVNPINVGIKSVSDGALEFVPESTFTGTISNISIKEITGSYSGNYPITDSNGGEKLSIRTSKSSNTGQGFGFENLFMGSESGETNTSGYGNVGVGSKTLHYNTSGFWNLAVGYNALFRNTVGSRNIALGYGSLQSNISGQRNIGIGTFSLIHNTTGCFNISIGADCLNDNVSGNYNVGLGYGCLYNNNSGVENVAIGRQALSNTSIGQNNIGLGSFAGVKSEGKHNIFLGMNSGYNNRTGNYNVLLGFNAGKGASGANYSQTIILGSLSGQNLASGSTSNIIIGQYSGNGISNGIGNIIIGGNLCNSDNLFNSLNIGGLILGSLYGDKYMELAGGLKLPNIPTSDPQKAGRVWNDNGTLKVSAG